MAHRHSVHESTLHFTIDPTNRVIMNTEASKAILIQNDHNSKRFSFELPRMVEGHDMSLCDIIEVHFLNVSAEDKTQTSSNVYIVDDIEVSTESEDMVVFTWLLSGMATKYVGLLSFCIRFVCVDGGDNGDISELPSPGIEYAWHTGIYSNVSVGEGFNFGEHILEEYSDVLSTWHAKLSRKVNSTTAPFKVYGTGDIGQPIHYQLDVVRDANNPHNDFIIPTKDRNGCLITSEFPEKPYHVASKAYVDDKMNEKVSRSSQANRLYGTKNVGQGWLYNVGTAAKADFVPLRDGNGDLLVLDDPIAKNGAASKSFVEKAINDRVSSLESLTLTYTEDTEKAYEKVVPTEVGKYALVNRIGGATEKALLTKNELDPNTIEASYFGMELTDAPITINADGSISVEALYEKGLGVLLTISMPTTGKYYYLIEGDTDAIVVNPWGARIDVECHLPYYEDLGDYAESAYFTLKIMVCKYEDSDTTEFTEAPEGTVFEPYYEGFRHADVERVDSIGANLFNEAIFEQSSAVSKVVYNGEECYKVVPSSMNLVTLPLNIKAGEKFWLNFGMAYPNGADIYVSLVFADNTTSNVYGKTDTNSTENFINCTFANTYSKDIVGLVIKTYGAGVHSLYYIKNFMINIGSNYLPYKPYRSEPIDSITMPEAVRNLDGYGKGVNDTYYNYIEFKDDKVYYHRTCQELVFNGTEKWVVSDTKTEGIKRNFFQLPYQSNNIDVTAITPSVCTHYDVTTALNTFNRNQGVSVVENKLHIYDENYNTSDISLWKAHVADLYASGNPLTVIYALATEEVTDITDLFTEDNSIEVEQGGVLRFANENKLAVPNTIAYVTRKG